MWFISTLAISPDGETLAFAGDGGLVHIWDTETGGEKHVFTDHTDGTTGLAFGKDSKMIASASNGMIILWIPIRGTFTHVLRSLEVC